MQHSPRATFLTGRNRKMVSRFLLLSLPELPPRKLILDALLIRLSPRSPYDTPDPGFSGSSCPDSIERRMEREASRNGDSTLSPLRAEVSKKCRSIGSSTCDYHVRICVILISVVMEGYVPFSAAQRLASAHSTSRSSSLSLLHPTRTVTSCGLASARASASHRDNPSKDCRL